MTVKDFWGWLWSVEGFVPRRTCGAWTDGTVLLNNVSDLAVFVAYLAIPVAILCYTWGRVVPFKMLGVAFSLFILSCGVGHLLEAVVFYHPLYNLIGAWKAVTAVISVGTVGVICWYAPQLLSMRSAEDFAAQVEVAAAATEERTAAEERLRVANAGLEGKVEERTRELAALNQQLKEVDRHRTEFLAMLSHELRNPLAPLTTALYILCNSSDRRVVEDSKRIMQRQAAHLSRLVDDLLDAQRISRGNITLRRTPITVQQAVKAAHETVASGDRPHPLRVYLDLPAEDVWVDADSTRVEQVFVNPITNSIKFGRPGGCLWIGVEAHPGHVVVKFRDDGAGIPADLLPRVYDPFVQGAQTYDRPFGGLGVGLTLAKYVVEAHGGSISVQSPGKDKGTVVSVRIPTTAEPVTGDRPAPSPPRRPLRVAIVDDNVDSADSLATCLSLHGYQIVGVCYSGTDAIKLVEEGKPDVVLLDLGLPGIDGFEVGRQLRATNKECVLVAVTGYGRDEDRTMTAEAGFDIHVVKPIDPAILLELITRSA